MCMCIRVCVCVFVNHCRDYFSIRLYESKTNKQTNQKTREKETRGRKATCLIQDTGGKYNIKTFKVLKKSCENFEHSKIMN